MNVCNLDYSDPTLGITIKSIYKFHVQANIWLISDDPPLTFRSSFNYPSTVRSFGIRNIRLYLNTFSTSEPQPLTFPCTINQYWTGSNCASCGSQCASCLASDINNCTSCRSRSFTYENSSCLSTCSGVFQSSPISNPGSGFSTNYCFEKCPSGFYFVSDGNYISSCEPPLIKAVDENDITVCNNPCYHPPSSYNYRLPDGSCTSCSHPTIPMTSSTNYICLGPCGDPLQYYFQNHTCGSDCPSPLVASTPVGVPSCDSPCPNQYIFHNSSCESTCPFPLIPEEYDTIRYCHNLCQDSPDGPFLFANQSCKHDCPLPLLIKQDPGIQFCINPCQPSEYLFENSSCLTDCLPPLVIQMESGVQYCRNPCYGTNNFLYPNGSCIKTCPLPLSNRTEPGVKYCENPCADNSLFLYNNQSCLETCSHPNTMKNESVANFCKFPCSDPSYYYYTTDAICQRTCPYPYEATEWPLPKLCTSALSEEEIKQIKKLADTTDTANSASSTGALIWSVVSSSDSTSACMGPIAKMLQYIRFMNISFPPKVQLMLDQQNIKANTPGFTQKMAKSALVTFPNNDLPGKFHTYKTPSSFFVNFWPALFNLSVILFVTLLVILIAMNSKRSSKLRAILNPLQEILKWNVVLVTFCGSLGDIVLFTALELHSAKFQNAQAGLSLGLCLVMNGFSIFVVVKILEVNLALRKSKQKLAGIDLEKQKQNIEREWISYKSFFECYRDHSYYQQIFLFIFIIRLGVFNGIIGYLYKYPLCQAVIITLINLAMLLYLIIKRPMRKLFSLLQQIILELVLLPFNICVLILAIMDHREIEDLERRKSIGEVVIYINVIIPILSLVLMACKFLVIGYDFYKIWKLRKAEKLNNRMRKPKEISRGRHQEVTLQTATQETNTAQTLHTYQDKNAMDGTQVFDINDSNIAMSPEISSLSSASPLYPSQSKTLFCNFCSVKRENFEMLRQAIFWCKPDVFFKRFKGQKVAFGRAEELSIGLL